jgi:4-alpha-glucanotransferase
MYVAQFALSDDPNAAIATPPKNAVASINTHDTPTFTSYWEGHEIETRLALGHVSREESEIDQDRRRAVRTAVKSWLLERGTVDRTDATTREVLAALLEEIARSDARLVLVNLEDLFLERAAQNVPGTTTEHANWRKRIAMTIEDAFADDRIRGVLERVNRARRGD